MIKVAYFCVLNNYLIILMKTVKTQSCMRKIYEQIYDKPEGT